jgi:hypothetical protein
LKKFEKNFVFFVFGDDCAFVEKFFVWENVVVVFDVKRFEIVV